MKNLVFVLVSILSIGFMTSCNKDNDVATTETLIEEIATSSEKLNVSNTDLPTVAQDFIADEHFETYIESVAFVEGKGYEITLGTEDVEYFNAEGSVLRSDLHPNRCHRPGPCGGGERIRIQDLPAGIVAYILNNYPDQEIRRAKIKGNYYLVGITGPTENYPDAEIKVGYRIRGRIVIGILTPEGRKILVFTLDGEFILERP